MPAKLIGAHMPTKGGLHNAVRNAKAIGCTAVQVFTSSPQQWSSKPIDESQATALKSALLETEIGEHIVSHDSYLINLAAPDEAKRRQSIEALSRELTRCGQLGIPFVVSHMGGHMDQGREKGLELVVEGAREVLQNCPPHVTLLMETTAGQGSSLNWQFEDLAFILDELKRPKNLAVCLDTCHIFVAGYDIRTPEVFTATFEKFQNLVGFDRLSVVHCNDSKKDIGTKVDRHNHLGEGFIGETAFRCLVHDPRFEHIPILVETPDADTHHSVNVGRLWQWTKDPTPW